LLPTSIDQPESITISSDDRVLTDGAVITAVSSDADLVVTSDASGVASNGKVTFTINYATGKTAADVDANAIITFSTSNYNNLVLAVKTDKLKSNDAVEIEKSPGSFSLAMITGVDRVVTIASFRDAATRATNATITGVTIADGVATVTTSANHHLAVGDSVTIAGLTPATGTLNGARTVTEVISTTSSGATSTKGFKFDAPGVTGPVVVISSAKIENGFVTITTPANHGLDVGNTVKIAGLTPSSLNGDRVITDKDDKTFKFAVPGSETGAVTAPSAPSAKRSEVTVTTSDATVIAAPSAATSAASIDTSVDAPTLSGDKIPFTLKALKAGQTTLTFASTNSGIAPLVVTVTVTDPKLISSASSLVLTSDAQSVRISSGELRFTDANALVSPVVAGTRVTAVSSDPDVSVSATTSEYSADGAVIFDVKFANGKSAADVPAGATITFSATNGATGYAPVVVKVAASKLESDLAVVP